MLVTDRLVSETQFSVGRLRLPLWTCDEDKLFEEMENEGSFHALSFWFFLRQQITSIVALCGFPTRQLMAVTCASHSGLGQGVTKNKLLWGCSGVSVALTYKIIFSANNFVN